ncbi:MAG: DNA polymerase [Patescibacteria group bacterium]
MKILLIIDANALIHRCFHALPGLTTKDGQASGALYGLSSILIKIFREEPPDFITAFFDRPEPTFRKEAFKEYKIHRPKAPNELISQIIEAHELFNQFGVKTFEAPGFEADDLIGTAVEKFKDTADLKIIILTGDLDTLQLIENEKVVVKTLKKGITETITYNEASVKERFSISPDQLPDYKGLVGDQSDNILGVPGIGPKTAGSLIQKHQNLEAIIEFSKKNKEEKAYKKIFDFWEQALLSKKLAVIRRDAPLLIKNIAELKYHGLNLKTISDYFEKLGFKSLVSRINNFHEPQKNKSQKEEKTAELIIDKNIASQEKNFNLLIALQLIDPGLKKFSVFSLTKKFLKKDFVDSKEAIETLFDFAKAKIKEYGLEKVFFEIELPLIPILEEMNDWGIKIDLEKLEEIKEEYAEKITVLTEEIHQASGQPFNINSPKQMLDIFTEKFQTKISSTGADKLILLKTSASKNNRKLEEFIDLILKYREVFKLQSTYIEPLLRNSSGRVHTTFLQLGAATGRMSSENPNLQTIPDEIKHVFIPSEEFRLVSFDYSQIELRIMAHLSDDPKMNQAFNQGKDIHTITASQVFHVRPENVTPQMRKIAKTLNFGVIYGMGSRAFSQTSGLSKAESQKFIREYFNDFQNIKIWQEEILKQAKSFGYVRNINGRRRWLFDIVSFNPRLASEAERAAINMPVQSLAADIIKLAMIKTKDELEKKSWWGTSVRLLLSIHDELLFEIKNDLLKNDLESEVVALIKNSMENIFPLSVPLKVETKIEKNWS